MTELNDYINVDLIKWLQDNGLNYKLANISLDKGALNLFYNDNFCIKVYDRLGHGFGVTVNIADNYDESIYDNDSFILYWAYKYLSMRETASFNDRTENQYLENLPKLISDLKTIIPRLNQLSSLEWRSMKDWIDKEAKK